MLDALRDIIRRKLPTSFYYDGKQRNVCVYELGKSAKGEWMIKVNHFGGQSSKPLSANPNNNWKCFAVAKITGPVQPVDHAGVTGTNHSKLN